MRLEILIITILIAFCSCSPIDYSEKEITFKNPKDGTKLSGILSLPNSETPVPAVILVHGSGPHGRDLDILGGHKVFKDIANYLSNNGIAVLRYDKRGVGKSGGQYIPYDFESFISDGLTGIEYLKNIDGVNTYKIGVIGISQGAIIAPMMAIQNKNIKFTVLLAGSGVKAYELFYTSQLAISKAAGFYGKDLTKMTKIYNKFWATISKKEISIHERIEGIEYLKQIWKYIDFESRQDFGFIDKNVEFMFDNMYHHPNVVDFFDYSPSTTLSQIECSVLAINGDKDVQVVAETNLPAIENALKNGLCKDFKIVKLKNHNHLFQKCETGKISEYKTINETVSSETLEQITEWIKKLK